jgi:hypothetical protein
VAPILIEKRQTDMPKVQINLDKPKIETPEPTFLQKAVINDPKLAVDNGPKIPDLQAKPNFLLNFAQQVQNRLLASSTHSTVTNVPNLAPSFGPTPVNLPELTDEFVSDDMFENNVFSESETQTIPFMMLNEKINPA